MTRTSDRARRTIVALLCIFVAAACGNGVDPTSGPRAVRPDGSGYGGSFDPTYPVTIVGSGGDQGSAGSDDPTGVGGSGGSDVVDDDASRPDGARPRDASADANRGNDASDARVVDRMVSGDTRDMGVKDALADVSVPIEASAPEASGPEASAADVSPSDAGPDVSMASDACSGQSGTQSIFYLSDLPWVGTPVNGFGPVERDTSNGESLAGDGHMITIAGVSYPKGLGVHANSSIEYRLDGKCTSFTAYVGADDEVNAASITFEVWVDGMRTYSSPSLVVSGQPATFVSVNVTCATSLRLVVTDGVVNGNTGDHADWANAQVSCSSAPDASTPAP